MPSRLFTTAFIAAGIAGAAFAGGACAEGLTLPPDGDNQRAVVSQWIGPVEISISYHSPNVTSPTGENRRGKIWGGVVPYGYSSQGFGTCGEKCPWRGGANENTVFTRSHDVKIEGKPLAAGSYGLHFLPAKDEWTIIFSRNFKSWGSKLARGEKDGAIEVFLLNARRFPNQWPVHAGLMRAYSAQADHCVSNIPLPVLADHAGQALPVQPAWSSWLRSHDRDRSPRHPPSDCLASILREPSREPLRRAGSVTLAPPLSTRTPQSRECSPDSRHC